MFRKFIVICVFLLSSTGSYAYSTVDSISRLLIEDNLPDTVEIIHHRELANLLKNTNLERAHAECDLAIQMAEKGHFQQELHYAYRVKGSIYAIERKYQESFEYLYRVIDYGIKVKNYELLAGCYLSIGDILLANKSYLLAENYFKMAYENTEKARNIFGSGNTKRALGHVAYQQGKFEEAINHYKIALEYHIKLNRYDYVHGSYNDIGLCYKNLKLYSEAMKNYELAIEFSQKHNPSFVGIIYGNIGEVYMLEHQYQKAILFLNKDLNYNRNNIDEINSTINTYTQIATCYYETGNNQTAIKYVDSAIALTRSKMVNKDQYKLSACLLKANILTATGSYQEANLLLMDVIGLLKSIQSSAENINAIESQINMEIARKEKEVEMLKSELDVEHYYKLFYYTLGAILVIGILIIFFQYRKSRRALNALTEQYRISETQQLELDKKNKQIKVNNERLQSVNEKLTELNEEKNEFIRLVAHDLKNPLSRVMGLTHLIEMEPDSKVEEEKEKLEYIKQSVEEMNSLIERFLDVNRIESGRQRINIEEVNLNQLIKDETKHFAIQVKDKMQEIIFSNGEIAHPVKTDAQILKLIYSNILSNALKFSAHHQPVEIIIKEDDTHATITVKDHGPGLSEADKQKIFRKYTRLSARPTGNETSSGLGLYLVKQMSEKVGIQISYESELGQGTEMTIKVPKTHVVNEKSR